MRGSLASTCSNENTSPVGFQLRNSQAPSQLLPQWRHLVLHPQYLVGPLVLPALPCKHPCVCPLPRSPRLHPWQAPAADFWRTPVAVSTVTIRIETSQGKAITEKVSGIVRKRATWTPQWEPGSRHDPSRECLSSALWLLYKV